MVIRSPNILRPFNLEIVNGQVSWLNQPAAATEIFGNTGRRVRFDLSSFQEFRLLANVSVVGLAAANIRAEGDGGAGFVALGNPNPTILIDALNANLATAWTPIVPSLREPEVVLRLVGTGGDGIVDPSFAARLQLR